MYNLSVSYTDYAGKAKRKNLTFNLDIREVFKMLPELKALFDWLEANKEAAEERTLDVEEVRGFYNNLEAVMLEGYGEMSEDGEHFKKAGRYEFEESAAFNATMYMFVDKPKDAVSLLEGMLPKEMFDMVKNATDEQLASAANLKGEDQKAEVERLRAQILASGGNPDA